MSIVALHVGALGLWMTFIMVCLLSPIAALSYFMYAAANWLFR
jgi:hypothetical protein